MVKSCVERLGLKHHFSKSGICRARKVSELWESVETSLLQDALRSLARILRSLRGLAGHVRGRSTCFGTKVGPSRIPEGILLALNGVETCESSDCSLRDLEILLSEFETDKLKSLGTVRGRFSTNVIPLLLDSLQLRGTGRARNGCDLLAFTSSSSRSSLDLTEVDLGVAHELRSTDKLKSLGTVRGRFSTNGIPLVLDSLQLRATGRARNGFDLIAFISSSSRSSRDLTEVDRTLELNSKGCGSVNAFVQRRPRLELLTDSSNLEEVLMKHDVACEITDTSWWSSDELHRLREALGRSNMLGP